MRKRLATAAVAVLMAATGTLTAAAQDTIKIAYIDPLSGPGATVGEIGLKTFQFLADELNAKGGAAGKKFEILALRQQGQPAGKSRAGRRRRSMPAPASSRRATARRWPRRLRTGWRSTTSATPARRCSTSTMPRSIRCSPTTSARSAHFRWDANSDIKMEALTTYMKGRTNIKKIYLINQDYSFGQAVRAAAVSMLKAKRPDIQVVGDELHPLLKVTDFAPYIAKIKASGADSVITGNWGQDFSLLLKAAADAGLQVDWYTYYAGGAGGPTAIKQTGLDHRVFAIGEGFANIDHAASP